MPNKVYVKIGGRAHQRCDVIRLEFWNGAPVLRMRDATSGGYAHMDVDALRALAEQLTSAADQMESNAAALADQLLKKVMEKKGGV